MKKLSERHPDRVLDLLNERLTFERASVKLYDTIIAKMRRNTRDPRILAMEGPMSDHRAQEKEHEEWLEAQIRSLGGDAHSRTDMSDLIERESKGVEDVVAHDEELPHLFHALLTAELVDDAGWKLLLELADEAEDAEARRAIEKRTREEEKHLIFVRAAVTAFTRNQVLDRPMLMPTSP